MNEQPNQQHQKPKDNLTTTDKIVSLFLVILSLYLAIYLFLGKPIARVKALNPKNRLEGCLYYEGLNGKYMPMGYLDGKKSTLDSMYVKQFPFAEREKYIKMNKRNHCYKVKYIVVDFGPFTDFPFLNQYYLYDIVNFYSYPQRDLFKESMQRDEEYFKELTERKNKQAQQK